MLKNKNLVFTFIIITSLLFVKCKKDGASKVDVKLITIDTISTKTIDNVKSVESKKDATASDDNDCIVKSELILPYNQKIDIKTVKYNNLNCSIFGIDEYFCGEKSVRYIPLPTFKNINVIIVPMDCGDFNYRFFLLTILDNKVISKQYVEGEWYEPGDDSYKEITNFMIDKDYNITITTNAIENGQSSLKEKLKFRILDNGFLDKINN